VHAAQQGHASAQALLEVGNLAAHGCLGDRCDFRLAAHGVGDLVHAFDVDQRGVHVKGDEPVVRQTQRRLDAAHGEAGGEFDGWGHGAGRKNEAAYLRPPPPGRGAADAALACKGGRCTQVQRSIMAAFVVHY